MVGDIIYRSKAVIVKELLLEGKSEIIQLNYGVCDILVLSKNRIVSCGHGRNCLELYDGSLNLLKRVDKISEIRFRPGGLACYDNHIYITDLMNHSIIMLDYEFNKIKSIGSLGSSFNQFYSPWDICCKDGILYICDNDNQRIQIYNKDLEFIDSVKVTYDPWMIKITSSCLFVEAGNKPGLFIYELNSLSLKHKIEDSPSVSCRLSVINSNVYRFNSQSKSFLFYDENGNFKEKIIINNVDGSFLSSAWDGAFIDFEGNLLMTSYSGRMLIKFSKR